MLNQYVSSPYFWFSVLVVIFVGSAIIKFFNRKNHESATSEQSKVQAKKFFELMDIVIDECNLKYEYKPFDEFTYEDFFHLKNMTLNSIKNSEYICENDKNMCTAVINSMDNTTVHNGIISLRYIIYREQYEASK